MFHIHGKIKTLFNGRFFKWTVYILYLAAFFTAAGFSAYRLYMNKYARVPWPQNMAYPSVAGMDPFLVKRLGIYNLPSMKKSWFARFSRRKAPGVIRVGCLGDSFTYGQEVDSKNDYPTLLQRLFAEKGMKNVEVLNFGLCWRGFPETFMVWKYLAREYDLDYVLLGPRSFFMERTNSFNHAGDKASYYIHSRYVLRGKGLELVDIPGGDLSRTFRNYNSFIPAKAALTYDVNPPAAIRALLPQGRTIANPFYYYHGSRREEVSKIHTALLAEMAGGASQVLVICDSDSVAECPADPHLPNVRIFKDPIYPFSGFPYKMPDRHYSPAANLAIARYWFDIISGAKISAIPVLRLTDVRDETEAQSVRTAEAPGIFTSVAVTEGGREIGAGLLRPLAWSNFVGPARDWRIRSSSLLSIKSADQGLLDSLFTALDFKISRDMPLDLVYEDDPATAVPVGRVSAVSAGLLGIVDIPAVGPDLAGDLNGAAHLHLAGIPGCRPGRRAELAIGGRRIFSGVFLDNGILAVNEPAEGCALVKITPNSYASVDPAGKKRNGVISLRFSGEGRTFSLPVAAWQERIMLQRL